MATFVNKKTVVTKKPQVMVEPGLKPGSYLMEMVPVTEEGKQLNPSYMRIDISEEEIQFKRINLDCDDVNDLEEYLREILAPATRALAERTRRIRRFLKRAIRNRL